MERLSSISSLVVTQQKEWGEIFTGFETKNRYTISDLSGSRLYLAAEEAGVEYVDLYTPTLEWFALQITPARRLPVFVVQIRFSASDAIIAVA